MATRGYVAVNVSPAARDQLRQLAYKLTGQTGQRVTLDGALLAALTVADHHLPETAGVLAGKDAPE